MKFKKRFLMGLAIVGILLIPSVAKADQYGAVALNKWLRNVPTDNVANVADLTRTTNKVTRHQTVYWTLFKDANGPQTVQDGVLENCTLLSATEGCASAPLFIQSEGATLCVDSEMLDNSSSSIVANYHICSSSSCLRTVSSPAFVGIATSATGFCSELGTSTGAVPYIDAPDMGGSWIYIDVSNPTAMATGDTALFWVTGH